MDDWLNAELWRRLEPILERALELPAAKRDTYLDEVCGDDRELRAALDRLLAADSDARGTFLESLASSLPRLALRSRPIPRRIGDYSIEGVLGEGGMGVVYRAEQTEPLRRTVAIKVLKLGLDTNRVVERFEVERRTLAVMDHPAIARVFDAGVTEDGRPFFVMELVEGVPITVYCDRAGLPIEQRLELMVQACEAIQHAHHKGVIHRDIKPSNVLVADVDGRPHLKVIDFGIAKVIRPRDVERALFTEHGQFIGTPAYVSPEQAGGNRDIDTRTDVYSLGTMLYEILTGTPPFEPQQLRERGYREIERIIRETDPPRPSARLRTLETATRSGVASRRATGIGTLTRRVAGELDWVVMKALEKDRDRRYDTPSALARDLRAYLAHEPVTARPASAAYRLRKFMRRHRAASVAGFVAVAALLVGTAGLTWGMLAARQQRDEAERQAAIAEAVNRFLNQDLLAGVNPEQGGGRQVKLYDAVAQAAEKVGERFPQQPAVEASIRATLAKTFNALGEFAVAEQQAVEAVKLTEAAYGPRSLQAIDARMDLAVAYAQVARYEEAVQLFGEIENTARDALGPEHAKTLTAMNNLAFVQDQRGLYDESLPLHEAVYEVRRRTLGETHPDTLVSMNNVAFVYYQTGRRDEAETMFIRRAELCPEAYGETHPETINAMITVSTVYANRGERDRAKQMLIDVLETAAPVLGERHPLVLTARAGLGLDYLAERDYERAEPLIRETFEARREALGFLHPTTLNSAFNHATVQCELGHGVEALALFDQVLAGYRELAPEGTERTAEALAQHGACLTRLGRFSQAEERLLEALALRRRISDDDAMWLPFHAGKLADLYEAWGRPEEAAEWRARTGSAQE